MLSLPKVFPEAGETPKIPKAFTLQYKTKQVSRRRRYLGPEIPIKSFPIGICLVSNTFLSGLSLGFYILREWGRVLTDFDDFYNEDGQVKSNLLYFVAELLWANYITSVSQIIIFKNRITVTVIL